LQNAFPAYYELIIDKIYKDTGLSEKNFLYKLSKLRASLFQSRGIDLDYNRERAMLYTFFYLPLNFFKYMYILRKLDNKTDIFERKSIDVADLGSGPGSFYCALVIYLMKTKRNIKVDYLAIDESPENLDIFRRYFFNKPFRDFVSFPLRLSPVQADVMNFKKARPKDLVICGDLFSEVRDKSEFFNSISGFLSENKRSILTVTEPASRKKNKIFHKESVHFIEESQMEEVSPCDFRDDAPCGSCDYFDTIFFNTPEKWLKKGIEINQTDLVYRIFKKGIQDTEIPENDISQSLDQKIIGRLMMKDIYRKPKPPWRFKICDGRNGINHIDILVKDRSMYKKLMNEDCGKIFVFSGDIRKDKQKKRKSVFVLDTKDYDLWKK